MDILDDMGARKLSAIVFLKVNYSFNSIPRNHFFSRLHLLYLALSSFVQVLEN